MKEGITLRTVLVHVLFSGVWKQRHFMSEYNMRFNNDINKTRKPLPTLRGPTVRKLSLQESNASATPAVTTTDFRFPHLSRPGASRLDLQSHFCKMQKVFFWPEEQPPWPSSRYSYEKTSGLGASSLCHILLASQHADNATIFYNRLCCRILFILTVTLSTRLCCGDMLSPSSRICDREYFVPSHECAA